MNINKCYIENNSVVRPERTISITKSIFIKIFAYLTPEELATCSMVCRLWHQHANERQFWADLYQRDYSEYPPLEAANPKALYIGNYLGIHVKYQDPFPIGCFLLSGNHLILGEGDDLTNMLAEKGKGKRYRIQTQYRTTGEKWLFSTAHQWPISSLQLRKQYELLTIGEDSRVTLRDAHHGTLYEQWPHRSLCPTTHLSNERYHLLIDHTSPTLMGFYGSFLIGHTGLTCIYSAQDHQLIASTLEEIYYPMLKDSTLYCVAYSGVMHASWIFSMDIEEGVFRSPPQELILGFPTAFEVNPKHEKGVMAYLAYQNGIIVRRLYNQDGCTTDTLQFPSNEQAITIHSLKASEGWLGINTSLGFYLFEEYDLQWGSGQDFRAFPEYFTPASAYDLVDFTVGYLITHNPQAKELYILDTKFNDTFRDRSLSAPIDLDSDLSTASGSEDEPPLKKLKTYSFDSAEDVSLHDEWV